MPNKIGSTKCECGIVIGYDSILRQIGSVTCPVCMKTVEIPQKKKRET